MRLFVGVPTAATDLPVMAVQSIHAKRRPPKGRFPWTFVSQKLLRCGVREEPKGVCMPVDAGPVRKPKFFCDGRRGAPPNEGGLNLFSVIVAAHRAIPLVPSKVHRCVCISFEAHA
jgi:hypothetical protein